MMDENDVTSSSSCSLEKRCLSNEDHHQPPPAKRVKPEEGDDDDDDDDANLDTLKIETPCKRPSITSNNTNNNTLPTVKRSEDHGITEYVSSAHDGFYGILKHRISDFIVNEIDAEGKIVKLTDINNLEVKSNGKRIGVERIIVNYDDDLLV